jgi:hypothetical protein
MKMKKVILLGLSIVALISALFIGATAVYASYNPDDEMYNNGGQQWYLFKADPSADYSYDPSATAYHTFMMQRSVIPGDPGSLSSAGPNFTFNHNDSFTFFADESANGDVAFPSGKWILNLQRVSKGAGVDTRWGDNVTAKVGYFDGVGYTWFGTFSHNGTNKTGTSEEFVITVPGNYVPNGDTLVINLTNSGLIQQIKQSDGSNLFSPESDPGYPLPEVAAGILLGGGLVGLVGYIAIRKRKTAAAI